MEISNSDQPRTGRFPISVLAGSESTFTEITEHKNFGLILTPLEFECKSDQNIVPSVLILGLISFSETHFTTYKRFVADQSAISPSLGGRERGCFARIGGSFDRI